MSLIHENKWPVLRWGAACCTLFLFSCANAGSAVVNAAVNTAIATGVSAHERSEGRCYAACPTGTVCNNTTGFCERLPCDGKCGENEICDLGRCILVPDLSTGGRINTK